MTLSDETMFNDLENEDGVNEENCEPTLFVHYNGIAESFILSGRQRFGRAAGNAGDICVPDPYISRDHGFFQTLGTQVCYTASAATNGIYYNGRKLTAGETVMLSDGDKLTIPAGVSADTKNEIMLICALTEREYSLWSSFVRSQFDPLTDLPNRKVFIQRYNTVSGMPGKQSFNLFILDIDHFKSINDNYGHECGDSALKLLAGELKNTVDNIYHVCRWGGDEFIGLIYGTPDSAVSRLEAMSRRISYVSVSGLFNMTISVGLCGVSTTRMPPLEDLIKNADDALYRSKGEGRNRVSVY